jgi:hypothetical protein
MRPSKTIIITFFLSIIDLSFFARGTLAPIGSMFYERPGRGPIYDTVYRISSFCLHLMTDGKKTVCFEPIGSAQIPLIFLPVPELFLEGFHPPLLVSG